MNKFSSKAAKWGPARVLDVKEEFKDKGFVYKWAHKEKPGRIEQLKDEGWIIDTDVSKRGEVPSEKSDGDGIDSTTQKRELILMKLPKHLAKQRSEFYRSRSAMSRVNAQDKSDGIRDLDKDGHVKEE